MVSLRIRVMLRSGMRRILLIWLAFGASSLHGQAAYVGRFDLYGGAMFLESPDIQLSEPGAHLQAGVRARRWLSLGFDYSVSTGDTTIVPGYLTTALQSELAQQLAPLILAGIVSSNYSPSVPIHSQTQTFAAGPQLDWHRWNSVSLFIRPSIGAIRESAILHPGDPIVAAVAAVLAPTGQKLDVVPFYGAGGGATIRVTDHLGVRVQLDVVHNHLFSDILQNGRNSVRVSIGPAFQFGSNVGK